MKTKIKICGITNLEDALKCVELGADALGFIFAKSKRQIQMQKAKYIIENIPPFIAKIGVFVDEKPNIVKEIQQYCGLTNLQFSGDETPQYCSQFRNAIKTIKIKNNLNLTLLKKYEPYVCAFLFDAFSPNQKGGTGQAFNWNILKNIKSKTKKPIILAGGIAADNVADAINSVNPYAIDCVSGTELKPGKKDYEKTRRLINQIKLVN
ncbi:MAG: N-(5'-phosphoribosyl)anthranilate isomerase [Candidatus Aenigmarchaeota archaeon ex4484_52]|nr:MAG: N-(5'-phosphoribosyl)anthranilate isomerase [Candidatus Aenigmarchaeota archaeon ex4484_52]